MSEEDPTKLPDSRKVFRYALAMTIVELHYVNEEEGRRFLENLKFHLHHALRVFPEAPESFDQEALAHHQSLLRDVETFQRDVAALSPDEWKEGVKRRHHWQEYYGILEQDC